MRRIALVVAALCLLVAAAPAGAVDALLLKVAKEYQQTGKINPCHYTAAQLVKAKKLASTNDVRQYAPDLPAAIEAASEARASGACRTSTRPQTQQSAPAAVPTTTPPSSSTPAPVTSAPAATPPAQTAPAPVETTPQPAPEVTPAPPAADNAIPVAAATHDNGASDAPAPLVLLGILAALILLGTLAFGAARFLGLDPLWVQRARHASAEAGWRTSAAWAEFTDWVRLGR